MTSVACVSRPLLHLCEGVNVGTLNQNYYAYLFPAMCVFVS